ncbi:hypothetical protein MKX03_005851 [Papaver bracteatum]|nr:hypothetical protein MKX03_005851 [Papaver bracteatum]
MATSKFLLLTILFTLVFVIRDDSSSLRIELDQLKSKISLLESSIEDKIKELKGKDDSILRLEEVIQQKSDSIKSLQTDVTSLQKKGNVETAEQSYIVTNWNKHGKAALDAAIEKALEKKNQAQKWAEPHVESVKTKLVPALKEQWVTVTTKTVEVYESSKKTIAPHVEKAQKIVDPCPEKDQFFPAESSIEDMTKELEGKELMDVHAAWFPPWLATHLVHPQSYIVTNWNKHGKPALDAAIEKALEKKNHAQKWAKPHVESVKTKLVPALKEQWVTVTTKTVEVYESSKKTIAPHAEKAQKIVDPCPEKDQFFPAVQQQVWYICVCLYKKKKGIKLCPSFPLAPFKYKSGRICVRTLVTKDNIRAICV